VTITVSTIPAVKAYLVAGVKDNTTVAADPSIGVFYDGPASGEQPNDIISIGRAEQEYDVAGMVGSGGTGWLGELYHVEVTVTVFDGGNDPQTATERCCALMGCVIDVVRTDPSLGALVIVARPETAGYETLWSEDGGGRFAVGTLRIRVRALN
jgi:hypothetical protein